MTAKKKTNLTIRIAPSTFVWIIAIILGFQFIASITDVLLILFFSILISLGVNPLIVRLEKKKIPRSISGLVVILLLFIGFGSLIATFAKPLTSQLQTFFVSLPNIVDRVLPDDFGLSQLDFSSLTPAFTVSDQVFKLAAGTVNSIFNLVTVIIISYYLIQERPHIEDYFKLAFRQKSKHYYQIFTQVEIKLGSWIRGMLILMLAVGLLSYLGYSLIGLPFSIALGVIAAILEIIPSIGPAITSIVSILVGLAVSPTHAVGAFIVGLLVQQLENNLLVPKVMQKTAGLNPVVTILAIIIGLKLGGPVLAILSLPLVLAFQVIFSHLTLRKGDDLPHLD